MKKKKKKKIIKYLESLAKKIIFTQKMQNTQPQSFRPTLNPNLHNFLSANKNTAKKWLNPHRKKVCKKCKIAIICAV